MSGSPKFTRVRLRRQIDASLRAVRAAAAAAARAAREAEQRRQRAERETARAAASAARQAEEERRRAARVNEARGDVANQLAAVQSITAIIGPAADSEVVALERRLARATSVEEVRTVRQAIREFERRLAQQESAARAAQHAADLAAAGGYLSELRRRAEGIGPTMHERISPGGPARVGSLLDQAAAALAQKAPAKCSHVLSQADSELTVVEGKIDAARAREQEEYDRVRAAIEDAADRLGALRADPMVSRWCGADLAAAAQVLGRADEFLRGGRPAEAGAAAADVERAAEDVARRAAEVQLNEDRRQYVVNGIVQAMGRLGFVVQSGSPSLEHPGVASSSVIIHAHRIGGGAVAVSVPQQGDVWYDVDGYPKRTEGVRDGQVITSCDEAEAVLTRLHEVIASEFGIETDGLHWQGKDPARLRKQADQLPGGAKAGEIPGGKG
jgi:hypothetical protein